MRRARAPCSSLIYRGRGEHVVLFISHYCFRRSKLIFFFLYVRKTLSRCCCCYLQYIGRPAYLLLHIMYIYIHTHTHTPIAARLQTMGARRGVIGYMVSHSGRFKFERRADRRGLTLLSTSRPVFFQVTENAPAFQELVRLIYWCRPGWIIYCYIFCTGARYTLTDGLAVGEGGITKTTHETTREREREREKKSSSAHITRRGSTPNTA